MKPAISSEVRVLVCGGRDFYDWAFVCQTLDSIRVVEGVDFTVIHGGAWGADLMAHFWAISRGMAVREFKAPWSLRGKGAGFQRNTEMLTLGRPDLVVAFPGGPGTADTVAKALHRGLDCYLPKP